MLNKEEFSHLQKLSALSFDEQQTAKFLDQLSNILDFLSQLQEPSLHSNTISCSHALYLKPGVSFYQGSQNLFANVKHEKIANTIVVSSVLDN
jgi:hypothetical protein